MTISMERDWTSLRIDHVCGNNVIICLIYLTNISTNSYT